jgi:hypothetical protein
MRVCLHCGGTISSLKRTVSKYCTRACNEKARWVRKVATGFAEGPKDLPAEVIERMIERHAQLQRYQRRMQQRTCG